MGSVTHGAIGSYTNHKCRCPKCRETKRLYEHRRNRRRGVRPIGDVRAERAERRQHGTLGMYTRWGCKCSLCKAAAAHNARSRRQFRKLIEEVSGVQLLDTFPSAPLRAALRPLATTSAAAAKALSRMGDTVSWELVDRWCVQLGLHPSNLYPDFNVEVA